MNALKPVDVTERSGLPIRLVKVLVYFTLASAVAWRSWTYGLTVSEPYPMIPMVMCACLIAVLYTLSIVTLVGRSEVLTPALVGAEHGDSTRPQAADRATA